jgi:hypothetical protein
MIYLNKNTSNEIILTLKERASLNSPVFLFNVISQSKTETNFISPTISSNTRYDRLRIIETGSTSQNLTAGTVNLDSGYFTYNVYEQTSTTNLNLTGTTGVLLETGLLYVNGNDEITYTNNTTGLNYTYAQ